MAWLPYPLNTRHPLTLLKSLGLLVILFSAIIFQNIALAQVTNPYGESPSTCPNEQSITVPSVEKKLIQISTARPNLCIKPDLIFVHATAGGTLDSNWDYFNTGSEGNNVNAQFIVGEDGKIYQTVELYQNVAEFAITNNPYNNRSIGIEMVHPSMTYANKADIPTAQYQALINLVLFLMKQYNIPIGTNEADWVSDTNFTPNSAFTSGVYSHYQIGPAAHQDIGQEPFAAIRADLKAGGATNSTSDSSAPAGRATPYDRYARPYSWPISGVIKQNYGFTEEAQSLGQRFPGLYPLGDPNTIFSTTNHTEPPLDPTKSKYINPNIDIATVDNSSQARGVYATHAGWLTFADWAGPQKGYTIQIESDVDGDGQADLATRYMRLQAPQNGYFAPDIPLFHPATAGGTVTINGTCTAPANNDWANVNKWDEQVKQAIATIKTAETIEVPCNLVKAFMYLESGGIELAPNGDGYTGLMQVGNSGATGGGSDCNWQSYDVNTTQGNLNCGVQEIARGYKACGNYIDAMSKYFSGQCTGADERQDAFGTKVKDYKAKVNELWQYLDSSTAQQSPPAADTSTNPTATNPVQTEVKIPPINTVEAESMTVFGDANLAKAQSDSEASGGQSVHFTGNVSLNKNLEYKADQLGIVAKASKGTLCIDDPEIIISNAGQELGRIKITSTIYKTYYINPEGLDGSKHILSLRFANANFLACSRQVWIDSVNYIVLNANTPTVTTTSDSTFEAEDLKDAVTNPLNTANTPSSSIDPDTNGGSVSESTSNLKASQIITDNQTSNEKYVLFKNNGKIEDKDLTIPDSNYITIRARADMCTENVPQISVKVDDSEIIKLGVNNTYWTQYSTDFKMPTTTSTTTTPGSTTSSTGAAPGTTATVELYNQLGIAFNTAYGNNIRNFLIQSFQTGASSQVGLDHPLTDLTPAQVVAKFKQLTTPPSDPNYNPANDPYQSWVNQIASVLTTASTTSDATTTFANLKQAVNASTLDQTIAQVKQLHTTAKTPTTTTTTSPSTTTTTQTVADKHKLTIEYLNDNGTDLNPLCDMAVSVDYIQFLKYDTNQSTATQTSLIGKTKYVAYNQLIGYVSSSRGTDAERPEYRYDKDQYQNESDYYNTVGQIPNPSQTYLSYRIMYNNPNFTTFPQPDQADAFINAKVDDPYIVETNDNKIAGSLKTVFDQPNSPMFFFCALRTTGNNVKCITRPNP